MNLVMSLLQVVRRVARRVFGPVLTYSTDPVSPAASIGAELIDLQRDLLSAQLEQANANDLLSIAEIATAIAGTSELSEVWMAYPAFSPVIDLAAMGHAED